MPVGAHQKLAISEGDIAQTHVGIGVRLDKGEFQGSPGRWWAKPRDVRPISFSTPKATTLLGARGSGV